jgi:hypothetical protein
MNGNRVDERSSPGYDAGRWAALKQGPASAFGTFYDGGVAFAAVLLLVVLIADGAASYRAMQTVLRNEGRLAQSDLVLRELGAWACPLHVTSSRRTAARCRRAVKARGKGRHSWPDYR